MLTQDLLNEIFMYDPETGKLERKVPSRWPGNGHSSVSQTYHKISVNGKGHQVHRIIWLMIHGQIPSGMMLDHINGVTTDNRLSNLRLATSFGNNRNTKVSHNSGSGLKGVAVSKFGFLAYIRVDGKKKHIGSYRTPVDAALAYDKAAQEYYGEFARTNKMMGLLPDTSSNV